MTEKNSIINREASEKTKGFRLQKLRMLELIIDELEIHENILVYGAVEFYEDVLIHSGSIADSETKLEEDKNYNPDTAFTLNSPSILNTFVSFLDLWLFKTDLDPNTRFVFYATNKIGKERKTEFSKDEGLVFPKTPVLELLSQKKLLEPGFLKIIQKIVQNEYKEQYKDKNPKRITSVEKLRDEDWLRFLSQIDWNFNEQDDKKLKSIVLEKITKSKLFNVSLVGKEEIIFNELIEKVDERQHCKNFSDRLLNCSDVKNAFLKAELGLANPKTEDFVWKQWEKLSPPETRNLIEKIQSVRKDYSIKNVRLKTLKASRGILTNKEYEKDKKFLSIRYRVYEACVEKLAEYDLNKDISEDEINSIFDELISFGLRKIELLQANYNYYNIGKEDIIEGIVYELFESCFLAFD